MVGLENLLLEIAFVSHATSHIVNFKIFGCEISRYPKHCVVNRGLVFCEAHRL